MQAIGLNIGLNFTLKKGVKHFIPELKNRDDFDVEQIEVECIQCGKADVGYRYKFHGEKDFHVYKSGKPCVACEDKSNLKQAAEDQRKFIDESVMERFWYIPLDLQDAGFKTYKRIDKVTTSAAEKCIDYIKHFKESAPSERMNLLMTGSPGSGKSHLCVAIARNLRAEGFTVGFITTGKLLTLIKETYNKGSSRTENDVLDDLGKFDCLVLDDLGAETGSSESWSKAKIFDVINLRIGKPTIYTTNFNDLQLDEALGERIASRLYTKTRFIDMFTDNDFRKMQRII